MGCFAAHFCFLDSVSSACEPVASTDRRLFDPDGIQLNLQEIVRQTVVGLGYELVDLEFASKSLLRVTIDLPSDQIKQAIDDLEAKTGKRIAPWEGIFVTVEDCEKVTRQLNYLLTVENVDYGRLEVSSPGLDRPLKVLSDYLRFAGQTIKLKLRQSLQGRKNFEGVLQIIRQTDSSSSDVQLGLDYEVQTKETLGVNRLNFDISDVDKANLVPQIVFNRQAGPAKRSGKEAWEARRKSAGDSAALAARSVDAQRMGLSAIQVVEGRDLKGPSIKAKSLKVGKASKENLDFASPESVPPKVTALGKRRLVKSEKVSKSEVQ